jgi:type IV pilus assembly protein PilO
VELPRVNLEFLRAIPLVQKVLLLAIVLGAIVLLFYDNYGLLFDGWADKSKLITTLLEDIGKLDAEVQATTLKVKHLDVLIAANKQLELELEKKKERIPQEEEAASLLKQLTELGVRLGLDIKLWKPGSQVPDPSKLFVKLPVSVEVAGGYHTAALFFDKINKLPRIMSVSDLRMGAPKVEGDRIVVQTAFELTAYVAPPEGKASAP